MEVLRKEIIDFIEDSEDLSFTQVAKEIGVSKQYLSQFKNGTKTLGFRTTLKLLHIVYKKEADVQMTKWCKKSDTVEFIKSAFEYAAITRNVTLLKHLIDYHRKDNGVLGECSRVYNIIYNYMEDKVDWKRIINFPKIVGTITDKALSILIDIIKIYEHYHNRKFLLMAETLTGLEKRVNELSDKREKFLKECFIIRLAEIYTPTFFHLNNTELTRIFSNMLINSKICPKIISDGYYYMGMTYLLENKVKCLSFLGKSYAVLEKSDPSIRAIAHYNLNYVRAHFGELIDSNANIDSSILYKLRTKTPLSQHEKDYIESKYEKDSFVKFFKALSDNSKALMCEVFTEFFETTDFFFANKMINELSLMGENVALLTNLLKFRIGVVMSESVFSICFSDFNDYFAVS